MCQGVEKNAPKMFVLARSFQFASSNLWRARWTAIPTRFAMAFSAGSDKAGPSAPRLPTVLPPKATGATMTSIPLGVDGLRHTNQVAVPTAM